MKPKFSRRDLLKLSMLLLLTGSRWPQILAQAEEPARGLGDDRRPNVFIIVFDALSARHMSLYGYRRETTPNLAKFAQRATVFHRHYAAGNFTSPGAASLLGGTYPWTHRAINISATGNAVFRDRNLFGAFDSGYHKFGYTQNHLAMILLHQINQHLDRLPKTEATGLTSGLLSERLFMKDFNIAFRSETILRGRDKPYPSLLLNGILDRFKEYKLTTDITNQYGTLFPRGVPRLIQGMYFLLEETIDWIQNQLTQFPKPFLSYIHLWPPHDPYAPRVDFVDIFHDGWEPTEKPKSPFTQGYDEAYLNEQRGYYDENIAYVDAEFGRLVTYLEAEAFLEDTFLVFTSDHGELFERGIHGHLTPGLYQPVLHVPLLITSPGQTQRRDVYTPTSCVDLLPTLLHLTGQSIPDWVAGEVLPTFTDRPRSLERSLFAIEAKNNPKGTPLKECSLALIKGEYKLVRYLGYANCEDKRELYNLLEDPDELDDLSLKNKPVADALADELEGQLHDANREFNH